MSEIANPYATGGGGPDFENQVQTLFAVLMLSRGVAPCHLPWPISRIALQARWAEFNTDDFIVYIAERPGGREAKLLAQVKHTISITKGDPELPKVIKAAWEDYRNPKIYVPGQDSILLITGPLSAHDIENVRRLLEWARTSHSAPEFLTKAYKTHYSSDLKIEKLTALRYHLTNANSGIELSDEEFWNFLKTFYLIGFDLDEQHGLTRSLFLSYIAQFEVADVIGAWGMISREVAEFNKNGGTFSIDSASQGVKELFSRRVSPLITMPKRLGEMTPDKLTAEHDRALTFATLLGGWDTMSPGDKEAIKKLLGSNDK